MQIVSVGDNLPEISKVISKKIIFWIKFKKKKKKKKKKSMVILASAEFAQRMVKMNDPQANSFLLK